MPCDDCGQISLFGPSKKYTAHFSILLGFDQKSYFYELENPSRYLIEQWEKYEKELEEDDGEDEKYYREAYEHEIRSPLEGEFHGGVKIEISYRYC